MQPSMDYSFSVNGLSHDSLHRESEKRGLDVKLTEKIGLLLEQPFAFYDAYHECVNNTNSILNIVTLIRSYNDMAMPEHRIRNVNVISDVSIRNFPSTQSALNDTSMNLFIHSFIPLNKLSVNVVELFNTHVSYHLMDVKGMKAHNYTEMKDQAFGVYHIQGGNYYDTKININKSFTIVIGDPKQNNPKSNDGEFCFSLSFD